MSTTPRTDAFICEDRADYDGVIYFARELERENAKLLAANAELITVGAELSAIADELRKDKARLDWLADPKNTIGNVTLPRQHIMDHPDSMRAAIDAAMEGDK